MENKTRYVAFYIKREVNNYKMRDWIFARQRYWGEPVPIVHLEDGTDMILDGGKLLR